MSVLSTIKNRLDRAATRFLRVVVSLLIACVAIIGIIAVKQYADAAPAREAAAREARLQAALADPNLGLNDTEKVNEVWHELRISGRGYDQPWKPRDYVVPEDPDLRCLSDLGQYPLPGGNLKECLRSLETSAFGGWLSESCFTEPYARKYGYGNESWGARGIAACINENTSSARHHQFMAAQDAFYGLVTTRAAKFRAEVATATFASERAKAEYIVRLACTSDRVQYLAAEQLFGEQGFDKSSTASLWYDASKRRPDGVNQFDIIVGYVCSMQK